MTFGEQEILAEFEHLSEYLNDVEIVAEVLPKGKIAEETSLLVCLPGAESGTDDGTDEDDLNPENMHVASGCLLDLSEGENRLAKYLMLYTQIPVDISAMTAAEVVLLLNELNRTVRVGHYFLGAVEGEETPVVQYRATVTGAEGEHLDGGVVADTIVEMGSGYEVAKTALLQANEECKKRKGN